MIQCTKGDSEALLTRCTELYPKTGVLGLMVIDKQLYELCEKSLNTHTEEVMLLWWESCDPSEAVCDFS